MCAVGEGNADSTVALGAVPYLKVLPRANITWVYFQEGKTILFINDRHVV